MLYIKLFIEREKIKVNLRRSVPLIGADLFEKFFSLYHQLTVSIQRLRLTGAENIP